MNKISGRSFNVSINPLSLHVNLFRFFLGWTRMKIRQLPTKKACDSLANFLPGFVGWKISFFLTVNKALQFAIVFIFKVSLV